MENSTAIRVDVGYDTDKDYHLHHIIKPGGATHGRVKMTGKPFLFTYVKFNKEYVTASDL